ncbi:hypothetical protein LCGC14_1071870 [marine sediment metagenome]|uniref:Cupin type-2 domain-containing protein n=1 Tax=marine sediment metagenome TaxID=412755 RepID=A0A0F9N579_9ZZZZ
MNKSPINKSDIHPINPLKGVYRKTLIYNDSVMLCHFTLEKNANIPMHSHKENQIGYVIKGQIKFLTDDNEFIVKEGDSYIFNSNEKHGALILENAEIIDIFNPSRQDYI